MGRKSILKVLQRPGDLCREDEKSLQRGPFLCFAQVCHSDSCGFRVVRLQKRFDLFQLKLYFRLTQNQSLARTISGNFTKKQKLIIKIKVKRPTK